MSTADQQRRWRAKQGARVEAPGDDERERVGVPSAEPVRMGVRHVAGPGSRLAEPLLGVTVFGVPTAKLVRCGCGNFVGNG